LKNLTVNEVLSRVANSVGLDTDANPYGSLQKHYVQLRGLLQDAGDELTQLYPWEVLHREVNFTTTAGGNPYALPSDFDRMIPGTHWDRANDLPVGGPLNAQDWQYLQGRDLVSSTIYASFRQKENELYIFPDDAGFEIYYEYISTSWIQDGSVPTEYRSEIDSGGDIILFDSALIRNYLRAKFYQAKGFDGPSPERVASMFFHRRTAQDTPGPILNAGGARMDFPYLDGFRSTPDTGYGT
jgi:hypothetical protein